MKIDMKIQQYIYWTLVGTIPLIGIYSAYIAWFAK